MRNDNLPKLTHSYLWCKKNFLQKVPSQGNLDQFGQKELVHSGALVSRAGNL